MLYVLHRNRVVCAALEFTPFQPDRWLTGQIVHFSTVHAAPPDEVDYAMLMSMSGTAWHIEILAVTLPRSADSHVCSGVTVRILRKLKGDNESLEIIDEYVRELARIERKLIAIESKSGAA